MIEKLKRLSANSTSITVAWDELSCVDRNGPITGYRIEYGITTFNNTETVTATFFTATRLFPITTYMLRVAAVGESIIGSYSTTLNAKTRLPTGNTA